MGRGRRSISLSFHGSSQIVCFPLLLLGWAELGFNRLLGWIWDLVSWTHFLCGWSKPKYLFWVPSFRWNRKPSGDLGKYKVSRPSSLLHYPPADPLAVMGMLAQYQILVWSHHICIHRPPLQGPNKTSKEIKTSAELVNVLRLKFFLLQLDNRCIAGSSWDKFVLSIMRPLPWPRIGRLQPIWIFKISIPATSQPVAANPPASDLNIQKFNPTRPPTTCPQSCRQHVSLQFEYSPF